MCERCRKAKQPSSLSGDPVKFGPMCGTPESDVYVTDFYKVPKVIILAVDTSGDAIKVRPIVSIEYAGADCLLDTDGAMNLVVDLLDEGLRGCALMYAACDPCDYQNVKFQQLRIVSSPVIGPTEDDKWRMSIIIDAVELRHASVVLDALDMAIAVRAAGRVPPPCLVHAAVEQYTGIALLEGTLVMISARALLDSVPFTRCPAAMTKDALKLLLKDIPGPTDISDQLADFLGVSRGTQLTHKCVIEEIQAYIETHRLQDRSQPRKVIPNEALHTLLGTTPDTWVEWKSFVRFLKKMGHFTSEV